jgi:hypothetical protein
VKLDRDVLLCATDRRGRDGLPIRASRDTTRVCRVGHTGHLSGVVNRRRNITSIRWRGTSSAAARHAREPAGKPSGSCTGDELRKTVLVCGVLLCPTIQVFVTSRFGYRLSNIASWRPLPPVEARFLRSLAKRLPRIRTSIDVPNLPSGRNRESSQAAPRTGKAASSRGGCGPA